MKVKFKTTSAGPNGTIFVGDIVEVSESEGNLLIDKGYAEKVVEEIKEKPKEAKPKKR